MVRLRRFTQQLCDGILGQGKDPRFSGIPVARAPYFCHLLRQGGQYDLRMALLLRQRVGGVHTAQLHVSRQHEGLALKQCVPTGTIRRRRAVMAFQSQARQPPSVIRLSHDLKLCHTGIVAGQKINRLLEPVGSGAVGHELAFLS